MLRLVVALMLAVPAGAAPPPKPAPAVKEAWDRSKPRASGAVVRANAVPGRPAAGYVTIEGGGQPDRLTGVTTSAPGVRIEMHSMAMAGGLMKMARLEALPVPAGNKVAFAPGGNHLMIFGLPAGAKAVPLTLRFASGAAVPVSAVVLAAGDDVHAGH